jgi:hypothetical protein
MDAGEMRRYVGETFDGVWAVDNEGDTFFMYAPDGDLPPERQFPFVTIVTGDRYDTHSRLDRPGTWRLNIGLTKATFAAMFPDTGPAGGYDYTARDTLMPHPDYGGQHFVCVVNPGEATLGRVRELLAEAHAFAARKYANHARRASA